MSLEIAIVLARSFAAEISAAITYGIGPTAGWSARTSRFSEANSPVAPYPANQTKSKAYAGSVGGFRGVLTAWAHRVLSERGARSTKPMMNLHCASATLQSQGHMLTSVFPSLHSR